MTADLTMQSQHHEQRREIAADNCCYQQWSAHHYHHHHHHHHQQQQQQQQQHLLAVPSPMQQMEGERQTEKMLFIISLKLRYSICCYLQLIFIIRGMFR